MFCVKVMLSVALLLVNKLAFDSHVTVSLSAGKATGFSANFVNKIMMLKFGSHLFP